MVVLVPDDMVPCPGRRVSEWGMWIDDDNAGTRALARGESCSVSCSRPAAPTPAAQL